MKLMKLTAYIAALAVMACSLNLNTVSAQNLLNNAGYESDLGFDFSDASNWNGFFGAEDGGTVLEAFNNTGAPAFAGAQALELTIDEGTSANGGVNAFVGHVQRVGGVTAGQDYTLSTNARNNNSVVNGAVDFRVEWFDDTNTEISRDQFQLEGLLTDSYQLLEFALTAPTGTVAANVVTALGSFGSTPPLDHSVLFDDTSFAVAAVPEPSSAIALLTIGGLGILRRRRA